MMHVLNLALITLTLAACPAQSLKVDSDQSGQSKPALAVVAYRDALVQGRPREAFEWIHPASRDGLDAQGFEAFYQRHREALIAQAEELVRLTRASPRTQRARVRTDRGDVLLDQTAEGWRLLGPVGRPMEPAN